MKIAIKIGLASIFWLSAVYSPQVLAQQLAQDLAVASVGAAAAAQVAVQGKAVESQAKAANKSQTDMTNDMLKSQQGQQPAPSLIPAGAPAKTEMPQPGEGVRLAAAGPVIPPPALDAGKGKGGKEDLPSPKIPDSIKGVIKRLNTATENVTLEDLNSAREAVAKLDILIDIEKRLNDLSNLRQEREEKSLVNAIPASALGMRGAAHPAPSFLPPSDQTMGQNIAAQPSVMMPSSSIEVQRITGAAGRYSALVKSGEGKASFVRAGDKLSDGSVVQDITSHGLTLQKGNSKRTVQVKDVAVVFNGR
jgi:hypothetical protein